MAIKPKDFVPKKPRPHMWDAPEPSVKKKSLENESRLSKVLDFKLTPGSGNTDWVLRKGDGSTDDFMIECKETTKSKISIGESVIAKLCCEAAVAGKDPVLVLSAYGIPESLPQEWVCFPASLFKE